MCTVCNKKTHRATSDDVYIGRPSKWGNPFTIGKDGTRPQVIRKYGNWIVRQDHLLAALPEPKGKNLVCWCTPEPCHGHIRTRRGPLTRAFSFLS
jgi:hypothetical protein